MYRRYESDNSTANSMREHQINPPPNYSGNRNFPNNIETQHNNSHQGTPSDTNNNHNSNQNHSANAHHNSANSSHQVDHKPAHSENNCSNSANNIHHTNQYNHHDSSNGTIKHNRNQKRRNFNIKNPLLGILPSSVYDPKTKKILGFLSAEDLLLIAMILLFLDNEDDNDPLVIYALIYILLSDYIDLSAFGF